ncbi:hypothetical protein L484_010868 [Morus notabilis]|uniref:Malectin-like domain-containing protein n=1 Tax=Morus notabilis TaxID=981085 RepID=W9SMF4_9ROSA|nr:hypothetical protein L484_010868 [Morus notabilis]
MNTFQLHFDGKYWETVEINSDRELVVREAIYVVQDDHASVCLVQIYEDDFPFISALELRRLYSHMYNLVTPNQALFLRSRLACGTFEKLRHRISPVLFEKAPVYINLYFSEVSELDTTERRSFRVYIDELPHSDPIIPPYGGVKQVTIKNIDIYGTDETVLRPTSDSTLSPILNAIEVYQVKDQKDGPDRDQISNIGTRRSDLQIRLAFDLRPSLWNTKIIISVTYSVIINMHSYKHDKGHVISSHKD